MAKINIKDFDTVNSIVQSELPKGISIIKMQDYMKDMPDNELAYILYKKTDLNFYGVLWIVDDNIESIRESINKAILNISPQAVLNGGGVAISNELRIAMATL